MNRKILGIAMCLMVSLTGIFAGGKTDGQPIKFGGVWPLGDITGQQGSKAAQLAVDQINAAGGLLGRQVQLIVIDSELNPEKGAAAIERLVNVERVDFLVGGMASGVHLGQIPIMKQYQKITMWTGAASHLAEEAMGPNQDWYFHLHPWDYNQGESYVKGWAEIAAKYPKIKTARIFLAYEEGAFGSASYAATKALFSNAQIDGEAFKSAAQGGGDYTAVLERAKAYKPDIFLWAGYDADALPMLEQAKAIDFTPGLFVGAPPGWPANFGSSPLAESVSLYGMWAPSLNAISPASKKFYDAYKAKYSEEPATYFAPLSYSAIEIVADAVKKAGTVDQAKVIAELKKTKYDSPLGETITFGPSKVISNQGIRGQKILQWQNGVQQVLWPLNLATAAPEFPFKPWNAR